MQTPAIDRELTKVFQSKPWRQVFRAQLAASITSACTAPAGVIKPEARAREAVAIADAILQEVGL